jgi:hypothetical protein
LPEFKTTPNSRDGAKKIDTSGMRRSWRYQLPNGTSYEQVVDVLLATPEETIEAFTLTREGKNHKVTQNSERYGGKRKY